MNLQPLIIEKTLYDLLSEKTKIIAQQAQIIEALQKQIAAEPKKEDTKES